MRSRPTSKAAAAATAAAGLLALSGLFWHSARAPVAPAPAPDPLRVVFFGDLMLDRGVARRAAQGGGAALVAGVRELAARNDLVVLNLEGTITGNESVAARDHTILRFTFDPSLAGAVLGALGADAVSLANNHALDFYAAGYDETVRNLSALGVAHFGHPLNARALSATLRHGDAQLCLVGYHELFDPSTAATVAEVERLRAQGQCAAIVVMPHWGLEYEPLPSSSQQEKGRAFIDAGADLVVGTHPHVVQPVEVYRGKAIFYSLGNFVFDQDFSWETTHGLALEARFGAEGTALILVPLGIEGSRPAVLAGEERGRIIQAAGGVDTVLLP